MQSTLRIHSLMCMVQLFNIRTQGEAGNLTPVWAAVLQASIVELTPGRPFTSPSHGSYSSPPWACTLRLLTSLPCALRSLPLDFCTPLSFHLLPHRGLSNLHTEFSLSQEVAGLVFHVDTLVPASTWVSRCASLVPSGRCCPELRDLVLTRQPHVSLFFATYLGDAD